MKKLKYIYVAGPLTTGDVFKNISRAIDAGDVLRQLGYAPFIPHALCVWEIKHNANYEAWMEYDLLWLARCDGLLRLPGESKGADREVAFAVANNIPVFHSIADLLDYGKWNPVRTIDA